MWIKKIMSACLSLVIAVSALSFTVVEASAGVVTTQEDVASVNSYDTLQTYGEFYGKTADGAFVTPGLVSSASYNKDTGIFSTCNTMCPQAMCKVGHYTLITAYDSNEVCKSVIYVLDSNKSLVKTLVLPDSYHVGGIAYDSANGAILVTKASKCVVGIISYEDFTKYLRFSSSFVNIDYTIEENDADKYIESASSVTYKNGRV